MSERGKAMTAEALLAHYAAGERDFRGVNLEGADLAGADLALATLANANLKSANLEGTNLEGASLAFANLTGAILEAAHLIDANLVGATLKGARLKGAHLAGANLEEANLKSVESDGVRFAAAKPSIVRLGGKVRGRGVIRPDDAIRARVGGGHDRPVSRVTGDGGRRRAAGRLRPVSG